MKLWYALRRKFWEELPAHTAPQSVKPLAQLAQKYGITNTEPCVVAIAIDATFSMSNIWQIAQTQLQQLVNRLNQLNPQIQLILIAYRDYCDNELIIEKSPITSDVEILSTFIGNIRCLGGGDAPEAIEKALFVIREIKPKLAILIGDSHPHGIADDDLPQYPLNWETETEKLKELGIPVCTLATGDLPHTLASYKKISEQTGGKFFPLTRFNDLLDYLSGLIAKYTNNLESLSLLMLEENSGKSLLPGQQLLLDSLREE